MEFTTKLETCKTIPDIFELVRSLCFEHFKKEQAGLMVGLADLGAYPKGWIGAFYSLDANSIIVNKKPLKKIPKRLQKPYLFHLILHEYLHSIGFLDESETRKYTYEICRKYFGESHEVTGISKGIEKYFPGLLQNGFEPPETFDIEFMHGIDRKNTNYIM